MIIYIYTEQVASPSSNIPSLQSQLVFNKFLVDGQDKQLVEVVLHVEHE